jgi:glycosyltransferase involved in cell wall biosynthesis
MTAFRVLHVIGGSQFGGIVPHVASLVRMAREHGGEATVLATAPRIVSYYRDRGIEVVPLPGIDRPINPFRDALGLARLIRYLRREKYSIVHTHTSKGGIIGRLAAYLTRTPIVIHTTHGYAFSDYATNAISRHVFLSLETLATRWCDFIIAVNESDRRKALDQAIVTDSKIVTIPNGIDLEEADRELSRDSESLRHELGLEPGRRIVGVIGRLAEQKGIEYFIDAVPPVHARFPDIDFVIVGVGELEDELRRRIQKHGLKGRVRFAGFRSDSYRLLKLLDVFVMPSLWEGMPITLLEAMAAAKPIVATRIKGIMDVCAGDDVAVLVEPADSAALAEGIIRLLSNSTLATRLGHHARIRVESAFSDRKMKESTWHVYEAAGKRKDIHLGQSTQETLTA